jgi:hypothetical protein
MRRGSCVPLRKVDVPFATDADVEALVTAFEDCTLAYPRWTHRAHLAVALVYLTRYRFPLALDRARVHIDLYNRTRGNPDGYHETITVLHMRRVARYLAEQVEPPSLVVALDDLTALCAKGWTLRHYSPERLGSAEARAGWVEPDREPVDEAG